MYQKFRVFEKYSFREFSRVFESKSKLYYFYVVFSRQNFFRGLSLKQNTPKHLLNIIILI